MTALAPNLDNPFNQQFGHPNERVAHKVKDTLPEAVKDFIRQSPFIVMATSNREGWCDASPKGGMPGFVKILDETHLLIPDIAGNKLFQSYLNMLDNPRVGIVFFIPGCPDVARVNGKVTILSAAEVKRREVEAAVHNADDRTVVLQGILIEVEEAYGHCPRALNFGRVWDVERIQANGATQRIVNPGTKLPPSQSGVPEVVG
jgi:predicted pyridoxine 5'-phosphate oxidase superfamily flavin-nucleotide-binding protein